MAGRLIGLENLKRKLKTLPAEVRAQMRADIKSGADEIIAMQKSLAPEDDGDLKDSIAWTFGQPPPTSATGAFRPKNDGRGAFVSADEDIKASIYAGNDTAYYARWLEFGTSPHLNGGQFAGTQNPGIAAQPFFFPAFRALKKRVASRISRGIRKAAKKVATT